MMPPADAARFLRMLGEPCTFQTFDESKDKRRALSRVLHGTLAEHADTLADLNARGAGVFVMVNEGDGKGRRGGNVRRVRAVFVDLDGAPLAPIKTAPLAPHCIVETSPARFHAYWLVSDCPLPDFTPLQRTLAARFDGDSTVNDLTRVMRLPGFLHCKGQPFHSRLLELRDAPPYTLAQIRAAFPAPTVTPLPAARVARRTLPQVIPEGERNATLFSLARGLVNNGHDSAAVNDRLQRINAERCQPPLCASEVDTIAARASGYGSDGFALLPHALLDSLEWKASGRSVHEVVLLAFRRFDGSNNGNIALTWKDFQGRDGFGSKSMFKPARDGAVAAGFLILESEGRPTQTGRKPDLFSIAPRWLPESARYGNSTLRKVQKQYPYIDKQGSDERGLDSDEAAA